jgi:hypothetical protein
MEETSIKSEEIAARMQGIMIKEEELKADRK